MTDKPSYELPTVARRNLSDEVLDILRTAILSNEIEPGTRLLEAAVAARLGVSRAPVREAVRQLEQLGLVESFPRRGAVVVSLPEDEIEVIYEIRAEVEARAFARAAQRIKPDELAKLEATVEEIYQALQAGDIDALSDADVRFHAQVMDISGLSMLARLWSGLAGPLRLRIYHFVGASAGADSMFVESEEYPHALLLDMLRRGDAEGAAAAARGHILEVRGLLNEARANAGVTRPSLWAAAPVTARPGSSG